MSYAVVQDVPASWEQYGAVASALGGAPPEGLILHVAGPTDEGFRTIEIWESHDAWQRFRDARLAGLSLESALATPTLRELHALNTVRGEWP